MKRRRTVSVTPAMGARMVAGAMRSAPKFTDAGTSGAPLIGRSMTEFSQYLRMAAFILTQFVYGRIRQFGWKPPHVCGGNWTFSPAAEASKHGERALALGGLSTAIQ